MKIVVLSFPGSNRDDDAVHVVARVDISGGRSRPPSSGSARRASRHRAFLARVSDVAR